MSDLKLTDTEYSELRNFFFKEALPDFILSNEDDLYYGYQVGDRMFDLNLYQINATEKIICRVNLCELAKDGEWHTTPTSCYLQIETYLSSIVMGG